MKFATQNRVRQACLALAALAGIWAAAIALTGGFSIQIAGARVSSHQAWNPMLLALAATAAFAWLARPAIAATLVGDLGAAARAAQRLSPAAALLIGGVALRLQYWWYARPLWLDEEMIALNIRDRSLGALTGGLWLGQAAPLGWLATERLIGVAFGFGDAALHALPVAFGITTLAAAWWIGRRWMSAVGAAALVFLFAVGQWVFHHTIDLKHYSADIAFGLLLPVLVVWVVEGGDPRRRIRRAAIWWVAAIVGLLWSMGGLLVTPACSLTLAITLWRRDGWRAAAVFAAIGLIWLGCFGWDYSVSLRFVSDSTYLRDVWSPAMAPASAGLVDRTSWVLRRFGSLASEPGGTGLATLYWITAVGGLIVARQRLLGVVFGAILVSAGVLAAVRVVPLFGRFTLWTLPACYVGIACALDAAVRWAREWRAGAHPARAGAALLAAAAAIVLVANVGLRAWTDIPIGHPKDSNHQLNDRLAVSWLVERLKPGDVFLTNHYGLPAVWWYGRVPLTAPASVPPGNPLLEVDYHPDPRCDHAAFANALAPYTRVLVYIGVEVDNNAHNADVLLLQRLGQLGPLTWLQTFADRSRAAIFTLESPERRAIPRDMSLPPGSPTGCLSAAPATRW